VERERRDVATLAGSQAKGRDDVGQDPRVVVLVVVAVDLPLADARIAVRTDHHVLGALDLEQEVVVHVEV
jgi:hypothetical protein